MIAEYFPRSDRDQILIEENPRRDLLNRPPRPKCYALQTSHVAITYIILQPPNPICPTMTNLGINIFISQRTNASFSAISDNHLQEQNNKTVKGDDGAVDILGSETALLKWMAEGPEIARMVHEFEQMAAVTQNADSRKHVHREDTRMF